MRGVRLLPGTLLLVIVVACQAVAPVTPPASAVLSVASSGAADVILVTVTVTGGECPSGACGAEYVVHRDGRVDGPDGHRAIPVDQIDRIADEVSRTDWDAVRSVPFSGDCPTAYDGQKHVYAFPSSGGDLVFDSCEFDLSRAAVFQAIDAALLAGG
jgi:hypothetical protein